MTTKNKDNYKPLAPPSSEIVGGAFLPPAFAGRQARWGDRGGPKSAGNVFAGNVFNPAYFAPFKIRSPVFFVLSKVLYFLLNPVNWILAGIIWWKLAKNKLRKKRIGWATFIFFFLASNSYLYRASMLAWQGPVQPTTLYQPMPVGIVLSGMTFASQENQRYFGGTADRYIQAAQLYHIGKIRHIIISGGDGSLAQKRSKEADFIKIQFERISIPAQHITAESLSRNTYENAFACRHLLDSLGMPLQVVLITSASHMPRAKACFAKQGIEVLPWPANYEVTDNPFSLQSILIPQLDVPGRWRILLKEMIGLQVYRWTGKA